MAKYMKKLLNLTLKPFRAYLSIYKECIGKINEIEEPLRSAVLQELFGCEYHC